MDDRHETKCVSEILEACTTVLKQEGAARWRFVLRNGFEIGGEARHEEGWLALRTAAAAMPRPGAPAEASVLPPVREYQGRGCLGDLQLLSLNGALPGGVRFARERGAGEAVTLGEVPLDPGVNLALRLAEVCRGLKMAAQAYALGLRAEARDQAPADLRSTCESLVSGRSEPGGEPRRWDAASIAELCSEAGWPATARGEERAVVELDVPGCSRRAILSGRGGLRIVAEIAACAAPVDDPRTHALGHLLLRACSTVRMVRAAIDFREDLIVPRFEACFDSAPRAVELGRALAALSIACRVAAEEAEAVQEDERLARIYLGTLAATAATTKSAGTGARAGGVPVAVRPRNQGNTTMQRQSNNEPDACQGEGLHNG